MKYNEKDFDDIKTLKLPHSKINFLIWKLFELEIINKESRDYLLEQLVLLDEKLFKQMQIYENNNRIKVLIEKFLEFVDIYK